MSPDLFDNILQQFKKRDFIPRVAVLYHGGEPLLNPHIFLFIEKLRKLGTNKIKMTTNTSLLNRENARKLIAAGITDLDASYDGCSREENNFIRGNGDFVRDSQNLIEMLDICKELNYQLNVRISNIQIYTKEELQNSDSKFQENDIPVYITDRFSGYEDLLTYQSFPAMVWPAYTENNQFFDIAKIKQKDNDAINYCAALFETLTVLANGDVVPCCYDITGEKVLGNVMSSDIFSIWANDDYVDFRNAIKNSNPDIFCEKCLVYSGEYLVRK